MSSIFKLWRFRSRGIAATGPTPISSGSTPAATKPRKMPSGFRPFLAAILSLMITQAEAPSESWLALPALMVLPSNTGLIFCQPFGRGIGPRAFVLGQRHRLVADLLGVLVDHGHFGRDRHDLVIEAA